MAIPWRSFSPFMASANKTIGISFVLSDSDGTKDRKCFIEWYAGASPSLKKPYQFGDLTLVED